MKHYGDITKLSGYEVPVVDVITGGSPCQDLSVAGKRAGLDGERSGLFMEQVRIVKEMREHDRLSGRTVQLIRPRYMVWENVPGAFSSNGGKDFQAVLTEIVKIAEPDAPDVPMPGEGKWQKAGCLYDEMGGWSVAWRVHDAQYWGVPQRRKRICVLADFNGLTAPWILFDPQLERTTEGGEPVSAVGDFGGEPEREIQAVSESVSGNIESCGAERERTSEGTERSVDSTISFQERAGKPGGAKESSCRMNTSEPCQPSTTRSYGISSFDSNAMKSANPNSGIYEADTARTLDLNGGSPACNQGGVAVVTAVDCRNGTENPDTNGTLQAKDGGGTSVNLNNVVRTSGGAMNPWDAQSARIYGSEGAWHSLNANENGGQSRDAVLVKSSY